LSTPAPRSWIQRIRASDSEVSVREEILASDGSRMTVGLQARFDGQQYSVTGSAIADALAYTRVDRHTIVGTGTKGGVVVLKDADGIGPR